MPQRQGWGGGEHSSQCEEGKSETDFAQVVSMASLHSPAWDANPLVQAVGGCWSSNFRDHIWEDDWGWLHGDSLKALEYGNWLCTWKKPGPPSKARDHCWGITQGEGQEHHRGASFPTHALRQQDTLYKLQEPAWAAAAITCSRGMQATPTAKTCPSRHQSLPPLACGPRSTRRPLYLHTPYHKDDGQHGLRKEVTSIQTKSNKNIKPIQAYTRMLPHIVFQDYGR